MIVKERLCVSSTGYLVASAEMLAWVLEVVKELVWNIFPSIWDYFGSFVEDETFMNTRHSSWELSWIHH